MQRDLNNTYSLSEDLNFKFKKYKRLENKILAHNSKEFQKKFTSRKFKIQ